MENLSAPIAARLRSSTAHVLCTLGYVPDDKLDFKPSETAKSPRELIQHILLGLHLALGPLGLQGVGNPESTDLDDLRGAITGSSEILASFVENADQETMESTVEFFGRPFAMPVFLLICEWHTSRHAAQIDYIQTMWGDLEDHMRG